jgi:hypothetical protein
MATAGQFFDLENVDGDLLRSVSEKLRSIGYSERGVRKRLGLSRLSDLTLESYPYYIHDRLSRREPLDLAILLFLLQGVIAVEELETVLGKDERRLLKNLGILLGQKSTRTYRSSVSLYPQRDYLIFTDHRFYHLPWIEARKASDPVMYMGPQAHYLMRSTIRRPIRTALELCSGGGFQALYSSAFADRVIGVDYNQRAVNFARLNAIFNNSWNTTFIDGDLFDAVRGERFDYIVATPPSSPSPGYELRFRDGGPSGADVLRRIIAGIPDYLAAGGYAQVATYVGEREGEPYLERIRRWLSGANMNMHALKLEDMSINEFAVEQVSQPFQGEFAVYAASLKRWIDNLRTQRFKRIVKVILTLEWNDDRAMPPWTQEDDVKPPRRSIGDDILQLFKSRQRTRRAGAIDELEHCIAGVPDDLILSLRRTPSGTGFIPKDFRVTWRDPALSPELEIKPLVCDLLELVDNRRTVPDIITAYAMNRNIPRVSIAKKARQAFLAMFERGLITLDRLSTPKKKTGISDNSEEYRDQDLLDPDRLPDLDGIVTGIQPDHHSLTAAPLGIGSNEAPGGSHAPNIVNPAVSGVPGFAGQNPLSAASGAMPVPQSGPSNRPASGGALGQASGNYPLGAMAALAEAAEEESKRSSQAPNQIRADSNKTAKDLPGFKG